MKINLLKSDVYNKIAAGEVVEKPFNVVKELVENSIDAGATEIKIEIVGGGLKLIKVSDNGCGIEKSEISNAFASHATSKIKDVEDLNSILTLGFRGEALASISSVSRITLTTKTDADEIGVQVQNEAGNIVSVIDCGCPTGSTFEVCDLFFNIPARRKFLKKDKLEEADIIDYIQKLILSHPEISFSLKVNEKTVYTFNSSNLENAIFTIYGKEVYSNLIKVNEENRFFKGNEEISWVLEGFVGKPKIAKGNKKDETLFVNGRCVKNQTVQTAIARAFDAYLMKGKYPFYVLNLKVPTNFVDVNVHPTKQEVRFVDNSGIFDFVYRSVSRAILKSVSIHLDDALSSDEDIKIVDARKQKSTEWAQSISIKKDASPMLDLFTSVKNDSTVKVATPSVVETKMDDIFSEKPIFEPKIIADSKPNEKIEVAVADNKPLFENYKIIGRVFDTYIIIEEGENVHFLDQHALHERLLFDKFSNEIKNIENLPKQQLLMPIIKTFNLSQTEIINKNIGNLSKIGINFESFGKNTFRIGEIPLILQDIDIDEFLDDIFENYVSLSNVKSEALIKDKLATMACKAAIKAGTPITENEIKTLLEQAKQTGAVMQCPHGRPFIITYSKKDIEKWFKRIV